MIAVTRVRHVPVRALALFILAGVVPGCLYRGPALDPRRVALSVRQLVLYEHPLDVHLAGPLVAAPGQPLLLYATGDGGWWGKDVQVFRERAAWGYPVAGFSSRNYLKNLGYVADTTTPAQLARDYSLLITFSLKVLGLSPDSPVILVGVSRGAGLAIVAAGQPGVRDRLVGVLAVALTREEEYVKRLRVRRGAGTGSPARELVTVQTYEYLQRLAPLPVAVVQSTGDDYLPADKARALFGPDTPARRLVAVEARNHTFDGARDRLYQEMESSLEWIRSQAPPVSARDHR